MYLAKYSKDHVQAHSLSALIDFLSFKNLSGTPTVTPSNRNYSKSALEVLTKILRYLKEDVLERIGRTIPSARCNPPDDLVLWVLTVPSLWTNMAKRFLREAGQLVCILIDN